MARNELLLSSIPEYLTNRVDRLFLTEDQPLSVQHARLSDCLSFIYNCLSNLRVGDGWTNLEVCVSAQSLRKTGFVSDEQEDHLTEADRVSLRASFESDGALTLEERYFRTDPAVSPDVRLNLHRDMVKKFKIKNASDGSFEISLDSFFSPQTRLAVFPTSEVLPQAYREISGTQFDTKKTMEHPTREITPKDINRLLFILISGLFDLSLHPPSSPVTNGN